MDSTIMRMWFDTRQDRLVRLREQRAKARSLRAEGLHRCAKYHEWCVMQDMRYLRWINLRLRREAALGMC